MNPLKVEVERIVHPLKAREHLKDVFREELWGHLAALQAEESGGTRDENRVLEVAVRRLGEAELLRAAFMNSLSRLDRWEGWFICLPEPKSGNGLLRHAVRLAAWVFVPPWFCLMVFLIATFPLPGMDTGTYVVTAVTYTLALFVIAAYTCLCVVEIERAKATRKNAGDQSSPRLTRGWRFATGMLLLGGVTLLIWLGGHLLLSWLLRLHGQHELVHVYDVFCRDFLVLLCVSLSVLAVVLVNGVTWCSQRNRTLHDWPYAYTG